MMALVPSKAYTPRPFDCDLLPGMTRNKKDAYSKRENVVERAMLEEGFGDRSNRTYLKRATGLNGFSQQQYER